ncbi:MAG: helicase HerA-like domain-containing protein [Chitinophagales bacterium]
MATQEQFSAEVNQGYTFQGASILIGGAMLDSKSVPSTQIKLPLKTLNRHGLIAGATGTGKTKTIQTLSEKLAENGVSVLMMDIKGDFSGVAEPGVSNQKIVDRTAAIGTTWTPKAFPVELMSISTQDGVRLRATVTEFGPVLMSKILDLNDTQEGVVAMVFKFCDDQNLGLVDLPDFKKVLQFLTNEGKDIFEKEYGAVSPATVGTILRKVVELEQQGADLFFGETSFNVNDLLRKDENGNGYINIVRLTDIQDKPKLFSTFMLSLLAEVYAKFPERGDVEQPELIIFLDEAHLIFDNATTALKDQLESIIKLIRSKGVGIFFCTQNPNDIPESILAQLGLKVQHALRAFTAKDRQAIKLVAQNYPETAYYKVEDLITQLGIGEAFVTALNEKGIPTPLVHTLMSPPQSRMDILNDSEMQTLIQKSSLYRKYKETIDPESAYEILGAKIEQAQQQQSEQIAQELQEKEQAKLEKEQAKAEKTTKAGKSTLDKMLNNTVTRQLARTATREVARGLLGVLKGMFK